MKLKLIKKDTKLRVITDLAENFKKGDILTTVNDEEYDGQDSRARCLLCVIDGDQQSGVVFFDQCELVK